MAQYFFDTSALVKHYHPEVGSQRIATTVSLGDRRIWVSNLGLLETQSAFGVKVRTGHLDQSAAGEQRAMMMLDVAAGVFGVVRLSAEHLSEAGKLLARHCFSRRLRTLDALQLAVAVELHSFGLLDYFVAADKAMLEVAKMEGLSVINPEEPE